MGAKPVHTGGVWFAKRKGDAHWIIEATPDGTKDDFGAIITMLDRTQDGNQRFKQMTEYDATIMAASPTLYEALRQIEMMRGPTSISKARKLAREAMARVRPQ